jgi:predicted dienelactone hydrolase
MHNSGPLRHALALLFFVLIAFVPFAARAAGIRDFVIPADKNGQRILAQLWTPCAKPASEIVVHSEIWPVAIHGVKDCAITQKNLPLVIISHGLFGDRFSHHDTAEFLADAGFAVVSLNHTQDSVLSYNDKSVSDISPFLVRPIDIKRVMDWLMIHPQAGLDIDRNRIGFFGFSSGGYTGLVLAGAAPDFHHPEFPCLEKIPLCQEMSDNNIPPHPAGYEPRIKAFVLADPLSFFCGQEHVGGGESADPTMELRTWWHGRKPRKCRGHSPRPSSHAGISPSAQLHPHVFHLPVHARFRQNQPASGVYRSARF